MQKIRTCVGSLCCQLGTDKCAHSGGRFVTGKRARVRLMLAQLNGSEAGAARVRALAICAAQSVNLRLRVVSRSGIGQAKKISGGRARGFECRQHH